MALDRSAPQSVEFERAVLGGLIQNPEMLRDVAEILRPDDFFRADHGRLFSLLRQMEAQGEPIDLVTVPERAARDGRSEQYGGLQYVLELPDHAPATVNLGHYAAEIVKKATLRRFIESQQRLVQRAYDQLDEPGSLLELASQEISSLGRTHGKQAWNAISLVIDEELLNIQKLSERPDGLTGVQTGFTDLDQIRSGMQRGDLIILAARPSMGKTALALNMALNAALLDKVAVGVFSFEMSRHQLTSRMLATHAEVDSTKIRTGRLDPDEWEKIFATSDFLRQAKIHIDDSPGLTLAELRVRARRLSAQEGGLGAIVIDYMQLMHAEDPTIPRTQQVSEWSRGLKALAKELACPVIALSQLSRNVESRQDKRPIPSDLRESGSIEQDADVILFIYRDEYYNKETTTDKGLAEVIIAKHRNGAVGTVKLVFQGQYTKFANHADARHGGL